MNVDSRWALVTVEANQGLNRRVLTLYGFSSLESFRLYTTSRKMLEMTPNVMRQHATGKGYGPNK